MATVVLGALGTLVGGPVGGLIGALAGRQLDGVLIGSGRREGPRLKDLAISTSSYGQPIPRVFGRTRVAGSIIWATDLIERQTRSGGGKGKPSVTSFSYTTSFAVAVSSRPIESIGRVWADGQLLRGSAGDLKTGGTMRVHYGHDDQPVDPLIAAAIGAQCPAFRSCAYVVFEDLQLADFGNRIPALSFEVIADDAVIDVSDLVSPLGASVTAQRALPGLVGFEQTGGSTAEALELIDVLYPLQIDSRGEVLSVTRALQLSDAAVALPLPAASADKDGFAPRTGGSLTATNRAGASIAAIRYYDVDRDFQPGVQRREGDGASGTLSGQGGTAEYPAVFHADTVRGLLRAAWVRSSGGTVLLRYRTASLDPAIRPGALVSVPGETGLWTVNEWEWSASGVELLLRRVRPQSAISGLTDPGLALPPADAPVLPSWLHAFELPLDDPSQHGATRRYLAASSASAGWRGAEIMAADGAAFVPLGASGRQRSVAGTLVAALPPSPALQIEPQSEMIVALIGSDMALTAASRADLAAGANRMLVGTEIVQYLDAESLGGGHWRLSGLLRGRGGTEDLARAGQPSGARIVALDGPLVAIDALEPQAANASEFAALGLADSGPVFASLTGEGASTRPPCPVHPRTTVAADGTLELRWTRRARGAWRWLDGVDAPLVEQSERYLIGAGPVTQPIRQWEATTPTLTLSQAEVAALPASTALWVRQQGTHALSSALLLHIR